MNGSRCKVDECRPGSSNIVEAMVIINPTSNMEFGLIPERPPPVGLMMPVIFDRRPTEGVAMGPWMHSSNWDGWGWMAGWHLLGWALTVALVVGVVVLMTRSGSTRNARTNAEAILAERYARGEIDTEEFETRRQALR